MEKLANKKAMLQYLEDVFPQVNGKIEILKIDDSLALVKLRVSKADLRPGGTVSGPSMFLLADVAFYIAVLGSIGKEPLAVTTNCSINFIRKPDPYDLVAEARIFKQGRKLIVGDVSLTSGRGNELVAHATFTYARPSKRSCQ